MENQAFLTPCDDNSCCCLSPRSTAALISVIGLIACLLDVFSNEPCVACCGSGRELLTTLRSLLLTMFQMANVLLLLGSIVERALLLQIYLWYMLAFIVLGLVLAIAEFCFRVRDTGVWGFTTFVPEVILLFVLSCCLPHVDYYRKRLERV